MEEETCKLKKKYKSWPDRKKYINDEWRRIKDGHHGEGAGGYASSGDDDNDDDDDDDY